MTERGPISAKVYPYREKRAHGNIVWADRDRGSAYYRVSKYAPVRGKFPQDHPVSPGSGVFGERDSSQGGQSPELESFRARGYWASCFPEGDGITWKPLRGQTDAQCLRDIQDCFPQLSADWAETIKQEIDT